MPLTSGNFIDFTDKVIRQKYPRMCGITVLGYFYIPVRTERVEEFLLYSPKPSQRDSTSWDIDRTIVQRIAA